MTVYTGNEFILTIDSIPGLLFSFQPFSSYDYIGGVSEDDEVLDRHTSLTPAERMHSRSKSVRGLQDLPGQPSVFKLCYYSYYNKYYIIIL